MSRRLCANKRGISPVVATVILVAVTIVVAVAVAYWMGGIAGLYTRYEKVEFVGAYAEFVDPDDPAAGWTINMTIKNTGSADTTIDSVLLNGKPISSFSNDNIAVSASSTDGNLPLSLKVGSNGWVAVKIEPAETGSSFVSGVSIEVRLHSAGGQEYPKTVSLP